MNGRRWSQLVIDHAPLLLPRQATSPPLPRRPCRPGSRAGWRCFATDSPGPGLVREVAPLISGRPRRPSAAFSSGSRQPWSHSPGWSHQPGGVRQDRPGRSTLAHGITSSRILNQLGPGTSTTHSRLGMAPAVTFGLDHERDWRCTTPVFSSGVYALTIWSKTDHGTSSLRHVISD